MGRLPAGESGRTGIQAATTGKAGSIGPGGGGREECGALFHSLVMVARVPVRSATTLATRVGAGPEYLIAMLTLGGALAAAISGRRARQQRDADAADEAAREEMVRA